MGEIRCVLDAAKVKASEVFDREARMIKRSYKVMRAW